MSGNKVFHTGKTGYYRNGRAASGLVAANEQTTYILPSSNIRVTGNIFAGVGQPYYDGSYGVGGGLINGVLTPNSILAASQVDPAWLVY